LGISNKKRKTVKAFGRVPTVGKWGQRSGTLATRETLSRLTSHPDGEKRVKVWPQLIAPKRLKQGELGS